MKCLMLLVVLEDCVSDYRKKKKKKHAPLVKIRSDHEKEFDNLLLKMFSGAFGSQHDL